MEPRRARHLWHLFEPVHAVTYFAPECIEAFREVGLKGFWMGYFAARSCPLGAVSPGPVTAAFFNFHPAMVARAIPDAWTFPAPEAVGRARGESAARALRRLCPGVDADAEALVRMRGDRLGFTPNSPAIIFECNFTASLAVPAAVLEGDCMGVQEAAQLTTDAAGEVTGNAVIGTFPGPGLPAIVVRDAAGDQAQVPIGLSGSP
jgi:hypothetical protein